MTKFVTQNSRGREGVLGYSDITGRSFVLSDIKFVCAESELHQFCFYLHCSRVQCHTACFKFQPVFWTVIQKYGFRLNITEADDRSRIVHTYSPGSMQNCILKLRFAAHVVEYGSIHFFWKSSLKILFMELRTLKGFAAIQNLRTCYTLKLN